MMLIQLSILHAVQALNCIILHNHVNNRYSCEHRMNVSVVPQQLLAYSFHICGNIMKFGMHILLIKMANLTRCPKCCSPGYGSSRDSAQHYNECNEWQNIRSLKQVSLSKPHYLKFAVGFSDLGLML